MPRDLTELMERATSAAPPETHHAADITHLAARRQRRRTSGIAAGVAAVVLVAGAAGYGVTRSHDSAPEPADSYRYDQNIKLADAVPASSLPGYRLEPWALPSVADYPTVSGPQTTATYRDVDAEGRLLVMDHPSSDLHAPPRIRLYDGPEEQPRILPQPPTLGSASKHRPDWLPSFQGDQRLIWTSNGQLGISAPGAFHVTDLDGGHDRLVGESLELGHGRGSVTGNPGEDGNNVWGDRYWFTVFDHGLPHFGGTAFTLYRATFAGDLTEVSKDVAVLAVGDGRVGWITTKGQLVTVSAAGGTPHAVDVPLDPGCTLSINAMQTLSPMFAVSGSAITVAEQCGRGKSTTYTLLGFDPSGRRLVRVTGTLPVSVSIVGDSVLFQGGVDGIYRYDFVTGTLVKLGSVAKRELGTIGPRGAGDYVLWYDRDGGHVARIPQ
jgi:hypothetical protein